MGTLYDLLGALPDDNAEGLRTAFRKAAKATHPDLNPDNPEAALRFRQLVRAHGILSDDEQRATYDQLLAIALHPPVPIKSKRVYERVHRFASSTIAATIIMGFLVVSCGLLSLVSRAPVAAEMAALAPADITAAADLTGASDTRESLAIADEIFATGSVAPAINARGPWMAGAVPVSDVARGIFAYRSGATDFDLAMQRDPGFAAAYFDRRMMLYRMRDGRALADAEQARRLANSKQAKTSAPRKLLPARFNDTPARASDALARANDMPPIPIVRRERMIAAVTP